MTTRERRSLALVLIVASYGCSAVNPFSPSDQNVTTQALVHSNTRWQLSSNGVGRFGGFSDYRFDVGHGRQCVTARVSVIGVDVPGYYLELTVGSTTRRVTTTELITVCGDGPVK